MITVLAAGTDLAGDDLVLSGDTYRHLFRARRTAVGERLRVVDGRGRARWGAVAEVGRHDARIALAEPAPPNEPSIRLEIFTALPRPERASWLVEKATELGVAAIRFLALERAPRDVGAGRLERLGRVAAAAVEQCHRAVLPEITGPVGLDEIAGDAWTSGVALLLAPGAPPLAEVVDAAAGESQVPTSWAVLVGPEGGWTGAETQRLLAAGVRPAGLGESILRIETAAVVAAGVVAAGVVAARARRGRA